MCEPTKVRDRVGNILNGRYIMLRLTFPDVEVFNNITSRFISIPGGTFNFEHSLYSVSKWEYKYCKPFLTRDPKRTQEEWLYYFECMCTDKNFSSTLVTEEQATSLFEYINSNHTATTIADNPNKKNTNAPYVSSELLYANMAQSGIPFEADKWNLSRLFALLGVIAAQNTPEEERKMSNEEAREFQHNLNVKRRQELKERKAREANKQH